MHEFSQTGHRQGDPKCLSPATLLALVFRLRVSKLTAKALHGAQIWCPATLIDAEQEDFYSTLAVLIASTADTTAGGPTASIAILTRSCPLKNDAVNRHIL